MYLITISKHAPEGLRQTIVPSYSMPYDDCEMWLRKITNADRMWFSMVSI